MFGENFPYTNFHDLNMDWIIKIAKDFLDQYTHIQQVIEDGLTEIDTKVTDSITALDDEKTRLEGLLDTWYETHSEDIANELTNSLATLATALQTSITTFNQRADTKTAECIASIPADYSALSATVDTLSALVETIIQLTSDSHTYTNPSTIQTAGENTDFGFAIPYYIAMLTFTPAYSGHDGEIVVERYITTGIAEEATYTLVSTDTILMGGSITFYDLKPTEFILLKPTNGDLYYHNNYTADTNFYSRLIYVTSDTLHLSTPEIIIAGQFTESVAPMNKIIGAIQGTNAIMGSDGQESYVSADKNYRVNHYEVTPNTTYRYKAKCKGEGASLICFFDSTGTFISSAIPISSQTLVDFDVFFTTPSNCTKVYTSGYYPDYGIMYARGNRQDFPYAGKLFACIGDSRTWYDNRAYSDATTAEGVICHGYMHYLRELGAVTINYGISGATVPDFVDRENTYTYATSADFFILWLGTNDWQKNISLGTVSPIGSTFDATTTLGGYQQFIEYILNTNNDAKIWMMGNYMCWNMNLLEQTEPNAMNTGFKEICDLYAIPFLDLKHMSRINILNRDTFFVDDVQEENFYLHLNNLGYEFISNMISNFIANN